MSKRTWPRPAGYHWDRKDKVILACGSKPCRWCKGPIKEKRRQTFCGHACVEEWRRRAYPEEFRAAAYKAGGCACNRCGLDLRFLDLVWLDWHLWNAKRGRGITGAVAAGVDPYNGPIELRDPVEWWVKKIDDAQRWRIKHNVQRSAFDIDHRIPICEGGDFFDPGNLRVLCVPCHKIVTAELATRRAVRARGQVDHPLFA